ncbi:prepilin-type N-terminal cleavage/methylation domain-containing protein [Deinobacterium chartae]|uniref:Prepilin-type N-terminal cleavage/methylation domain-containing protein n=1 Tax=Deinobacterium chartae TaxID=521158 RepID=A0A841HU04_9DEIO|nr:prepilin-type N-terminal cleavage/methylation domain-containing protein [Deinobacterium chartae]MBB6096911.1 prepilin-type N-terminal cleavage/methylation domain-containing protein [Deinobacterium chartae]
MNRRQSGLTLVELLIALTLLALLVVSVTGTLVLAFRMNRASGIQIRDTSRVLAVAEQVRGQWRDARRYDAQCLQGVTAQNLEGLEVKVEALGWDLAVKESGGLVLGCPGADEKVDAEFRPLKRVTLVVPGEPQASLVLEVARGTE